MQQTIKNIVKCEGIGLHSGSKVNMTLRPAAADTGIVFVRSDIEESKSVIPAHYSMVTETLLGTNITNNYGVKVLTIEHLMAALWGAGIDNLIVELDSPEVPIMDGSSEPFVFLIECAGVMEQERGRKILKVLKKIEVSEGDAKAVLAPAKSFVAEVEINFSNQVVASQKAGFDFSKVGFKGSVSRARTFGFEEEVNYMRSQGLALGGSLENAIVVSNSGVLNEDGLRYPDEFVRHKILDCVGDLFLAGYRIEGRFTGFKSGHSLNNKLLRKLFSDKSNYAIIAEDESSRGAEATQLFAQASL